MKNHLLHLSILISVLTGCSFKNDQQKTVASYRISSGSVKSSDFDKAKIYDWACLTVQGLGVERTAWVKIDANDPSARFAEFKISNLLGGYSYTFTLLGVDTDNTKLDQTAIKSPCPLRVPEQEGWAQLGQTDVEAPEKASGTFAVEIPFNFYQPIYFALPDAPVSVSGTAGNGFVILSWTPPYDNGGSEITDYIIQYKPASSSVSNWTTVPHASTEVVSNTFTINGLANGTAYIFRVAAVNDAGTGSFTETENAITPCTPPVAPTNVVGTPGNGQVNLTWNPPTYNGGSVITDYVIQYSSNGGSNWTTFNDETKVPIPTSATVTGLTNGTAYVFRVAAVNAAGQGSYSSNSLSVTPRTVPGAPTISIVTEGNGQVTLTWAAPDNNGGSGITDYLIEYKIDSISVSVWTPFPHASTAINNNSITVTGLTNGTAYIFRLAAVNAAGQGSFSSNSLSVIPRTVPGAPASVVGTAGDGQVTLNWNPPTSNGGSVITHYLIQHSSNSGQSWSAVINTESNSPSYVVGELTNGVAYIFKVAAVNAAGPGLYTATATAVTPTASPVQTVPGQPTNVVGTPGNEQVYVTWNIPNNGGSSITSYTLQYSGNNGTTWTEVNVSPGPDQQTPPNFKTVTSLTHGTSYIFKVAAVNAVGQGNYSPVSEPVTPLTPVIQITTQPSNQTVTEGQPVTFLVTANLSNGNNLSLTYQWQRKGSSPQDAFESIPAATNSSLTVSEVTVAANDGDQYRVLISAPGVPGVTSVTSAAATLTVNSSNTNPLPTAPRNVTVEGVASQEVRLSWISPSNSGGHNILGYKIYCSPNCGNGSSEIDISNIGTNLTFPFPVNMLADNTTYTFQITANTVNGEGPKSAPVRATPYEPTTEAECSAEGTNNNCYAISAPISGNSEIRKGPNNIKIKYEKNLSNIWIWKEVDGNRILNASGEPVKGWQKKLNRSGIGFKTEYFTDINAIGGRVCPVNVFISPGEMIAPRCLYFDAGNASQTLDNDFSELPDTEAKDWLREWNSTNTGIGAGAGASYYEGNIKTCADKGMRLPTLYEVKLNTTPTSSLLPIGDGIATPVFGTTPELAVPSVLGDSFTWTASAAPGSESSPLDQQLKKYFGFSLTGGNQELPFWSSAAVRCVLPNNIN